MRWWGMHPIMSEAAARALLQPRASRLCVYEAFGVDSGPAVVLR